MTVDEQYVSLRELDVRIEPGRLTLAQNSICTFCEELLYYELGLTFSSALLIVRFAAISFVNYKLKTARLVLTKWMDRELQRTIIYAKLMREQLIPRFVSKYL